MKKIFLKKRQSAEFVLLNSTKEGKHLKWSAAVKENLLLHTKNVLSNGLASKETRYVIYANKRLRTCLWLYWEYQLKLQTDE
jgi:hypothetical protein